MVICRHKNHEQLLQRLNTDITDNIRSFIDSKTEGYCIFCAEENDKSKYFYEALKRILDGAVRDGIFIDLSHTIFPSFPVSENTHKVFSHFRNVEKCEHSIFNAPFKATNESSDKTLEYKIKSFAFCEFKEEVSFSNIYFSDLTNLEHVTFRSNVFFSHCDFHSKDPLIFKELRCRTYDREYNSNKYYFKIEGCIFASKIDFYNSIFNHDFILNQSTGKSSDTKISHCLVMNKAKFKNTLHFKQVVCENNLEFNDVQFKNNSKFEKCTFRGDNFNLDGSKSTSNCEIVFYENEFEAIFSLKGSEHKGTIIFQGNQDNSNSGKPTAGRTSFKNKIHTKHSSFNNIKFDYVEIADTVDFTESNFSGEVQFNDVSCSESSVIDFTNAIFQENGNFISKKSKFNHVIFSNVIFEGHVKFLEGTSFESDPLLCDTNNSEKKIVTRTIFKHTPVFHGMNFKRGINLSHAGLENGIYFKNINAGGTINLEDCIVDNGCLTFEGKNLISRINLNTAVVKGSLNAKKLSGGEVNVEMDSIRVSGDCDLSKNMFNELSATNAIIEGSCKFDECRSPTPPKTHNLENSIFMNNLSINKIANIGFNLSRTVIQGNLSISSKNDSGIKFYRTLMMGDETTLKNINFINGYMSDCIISGKLDILKTSDEYKMNEFQGVFFIDSANFREKILKDYRFSNCYIAGCSFLRSELKDTVFTGCYHEANTASDRIKELEDKLKSNNKVSKKYLDEKRIALGTATEKIRSLYDKKNNKHQYYYLDEKILYNDTDEKREEYSDYRVDDLREFFMQMKSNRDNAKDFEQANFFYEREMAARQQISYEGTSNYRISLFSAFLSIFVILVSFLLCPLLESLSFLPFMSEFKCIVGIGVIGLLVLMVYNLYESKYITYLFYSIYKFLNGYGNKPLRSTGILLSFIIVFSFILVFFNLITIQENVILSTERALGIDVLNKDSIDNLKFDKVEITQTYQSQKVSDREQFNLKDDFCYHWFHSSCWLLSAALRSKQSLYMVRYNCIYPFIFFIQYIFTPLMLAMIILSIRRKVKRG